MKNIIPLKYIIFECLKTFPNRKLKKKSLCT